MTELTGSTTGAKEMTQRSRIIKRLTWLLAVVGGFLIMKTVFDPRNLLILLNGLFTGALVAVLFTYGKDILHTLSGQETLDRGSAFTASVAMQWTVIAIGVFTSIYARYKDMPATSVDTVAFARYLAIVAAVMQITSIKFGLGALYGREKKVLWLACGIGAIVAFAIILLQDYSIIPI